MATNCREAIGGPRGGNEFFLTSASQTFVVTAVVSALYHMQTVEDVSAEANLEPGDPAENGKLDAKGSDIGRPEPSASGAGCRERQSGR